MFGSNSASGSTASAPPCWSPSAAARMSTHRWIDTCGGVKRGERRLLGPQAGATGRLGGTEEGEHVGQLGWGADECTVVGLDVAERLV
jgi:hypothetical protein